MDGQDAKRSAREVGTSVKNAARQAGDNDAVETMARVGYAVNGMMHLLIGWIALQLAFGSAGKADQSGAFSHLASNGLGKALLWLSVAGFVGLAVWQVTEALRSHNETSDRAKAAAKAVVYLVMGFTALKFARGGTSSSSQDTSDITTTLINAPMGAFLVGAVGLAIIGVGGYHVVKGAKKKFLSDLQSSPGTAVVRLGQVGYIAKGVALGVVGALFVLAAIHNNPKESTGMDGALRSLLGAPFGQALLVLVALGLAAYGLYSFGRARHAKV